MLALQIAATGMLAQEYRTEIVANNLANMNTSGYQRRRTEFNDLIYKNLERPASASSRPGESVPGGVHSGLGVKMAAAYRITEQGSLRATSNTFDLAIQGAGYFQIQLPNGDTAYTRDGTFQLNGGGQLVNHDGFTVQPGIVIPPNVEDVTINQTGEILAKIAGDEAPVNVGVVQIAVFPNEGGLRAVGDNLFLPTQASGGAIAVNPGLGGGGTILQGFVETSNVNPIEEIAALVRAQRAYDMNSKVMATADKMSAMAKKN